MTEDRDQGSKGFREGGIVPGADLTPRIPLPGETTCTPTFRLVDEKAQRQRITDLERQCEGLEQAVKMWGEAVVRLQRRLEALEKDKLCP